jgi:hypothetical protein
MDPSGKFLGIFTEKGLPLQTTELRVSVMYGDAFTVTIIENGFPTHSPYLGITLYVAITSIELVVLVNT